MRKLSQNWVVAALAATWLAAQNVGIGTTTPITRLHVAAGDIFLGDAAGDNGFVLHSRPDAGHDFFQISTRTGGTFEWSKGITLVRTTGNVGIGTTAPEYRLDIAGALRLRPGSAPAGANGVIYYDATVNKFKCFENGVWKDCIGSAEVKWTPTSKIYLGSLPMGNNQTSVYSIPTSIPTTAKEVLVYARVRTVFDFHFVGDMEFMIYTEELGVKYAHYLYAFLHGFFVEGESLHGSYWRNWSYNSSTFWLPITSARQIKVTSYMASSPSPSVSGEIYIIGYR
jgi:hypothetical protein